MDGGGERGGEANAGGGGGGASCVGCVGAGGRAGEAAGGVVLDPFMGSGTTAAVAILNGRNYLGCELNPAYKELQDERIRNAHLETAQMELI